MRVTVLAAGLMFVGGLPLACGGDKNEEANGQTLGALTDAEASSLCEELRPYMLRVATASCTAGALESEGNAVFDCASERQSCIEDSVGECGVTKVRSAGTRDCLGIRVADLRECLTAAADVLESRYGKDIDCDSTLPPNDEAQTVPDACRRVSAGCPRLAPGAESDAGDGDGGNDGCSPPPGVGGCQLKDSCFEVTDPTYTPDRIESELCTHAGEVYVDHCPTEGVTGRCIQPYEHPIVQYAYTLPGNARASCDAYNYLWCAP